MLVDATKMASKDLFDSEASEQLTSLVALGAAHKRIVDPATPKESDRESGLGRVGPIAIEDAAPGVKVQAFPVCSLV